MLTPIHHKKAIDHTSQQALSLNRSRRSSATTTASRPHSMMRIAEHCLLVGLVLFLGLQGSVRAFAPPVQRTNNVVLPSVPSTRFRKKQQQPLYATNKKDDSSKDKGQKKKRKPYYGKRQKKSSKGGGVDGC